MKTRSVMMIILGGLMVTGCGVFAGKAENPAKPAEAAMKVEWKSTELGVDREPSSERMIAMVVSPDGHRYASTFETSGKGTQYAVIVDGKAGKMFAAVTPVIFSADSKRVAYAGTTKDGKTSLIVDSIEAPVDGTVDAIVFSPDAKRVAYFVASGEKHYVVVDGKKGKEYDGNAFTKQHAYTVHDTPRALPRREREVSFFSPDSRHYAYAAQSGDKWMMVVDGVEGKQFDDVRCQHRDVFFSPDSKRTCYQATSDDKTFLVMDGREIEGGQYPPAFSADGKHMAYIARKGEKAFCVVGDEKPGKEYEGVSHPVFSPDSAHLAYFAKSGEEAFTVIDEVEGKKYPANSFRGKVMYSPDSGHVACLMGDMLVVDGAEYKIDSPYQVSSIVFSPDSKRTACLAVSSVTEAEGVSECRVVIDGQAGKNFIALVSDGKSIDIYQPVFSADSKHAAYCVLKKNEQAPAAGMFVVDGTETETGVEPCCAPIFDSPKKFHYVGIKDDKVVLVEVEITE